MSEPSTEPADDAAEGRPSDSWVRAPEARQRLVETTIELLRNRPFPEVTTRLIAEVSGVNRPAILRQFGSKEALFDEVAAELSRRFAARAKQATGLGMLTDPDMALRARLVAWLVGEGDDPSHFRLEEDGPSAIALRARLAEHGPVSEKTARIFHRMAILLAEGFLVFNDTHPTRPPEDLVAMMELFFEIRASLSSFEQKLGWDQPDETPDGSHSTGQVAGTEPDGD
jgi:AcrR family transcriptional regulator